MTYIKLFLVVLVLAVFVPPAHSQDDTFVLSKLINTTEKVMLKQPNHKKRKNCRN